MRLIFDKLDDMMWVPAGIPPKPRGKDMGKPKPQALPLWPGYFQRTRRASIQFARSN